MIAVWSLFVLNYTFTTSIHKETNLFNLFIAESQPTNCRRVCWNPTSYHFWFCSNY